MNEESNIEEPQYSLRSRDGLTSRYVSQDKLQNQGQKVEDKVKILKRNRACKKGLITKEAMHIKQLIEERGSRSLSFSMKS